MGALAKAGAAAAGAVVLVKEAGRAVRSPAAAHAMHDLVHGAEIAAGCTAGTVLIAAVSWSVTARKHRAPQEGPPVPVIHHPAERPAPAPAPRRLPGSPLSVTPATLQEAPAMSEAAEESPLRTWSPR